MVDIIRGATDKPISIHDLIDSVGKSGLEDGVLFTGYPIIGALEDKSSLDALLVSPRHGIVVFDVVEEADFSERQDLRDELFNLVLQRLIGYKELTETRGKLRANVHILTFAPSWDVSKASDDVLVNPENLQKFLNDNQQDNFSTDDYKKLLQAIQAVSKLKQRAPRKVTNDESKAALLNQLDKSISNLDKRQSKAVIETADGVQRIRGLAGSGKTIVLALKVAYLHSKFPDWTIGITYYTRSLKNQFIELITKFTIEHKNEEPDWSKIKILQAWGSSKDNGLYYEFCRLNDVEYFDFDRAKVERRDTENLIDFLSTKALLEAHDKEKKEIYDAILIDEAQDFSEDFLRLCYSLIKPASQANPKNKRLIYAYDELQKLNDANPLRNPKDIFKGIDFENAPDKPQQDIILEKCYRNSAPVLVTAHALGFGVYRENGRLVTMFNDKQLWKDVGYKVEAGELEFGQEVVLARDNESSPDLLVHKVQINDLIQFKKFNSFEAQLNAVADEIEKNLKEDELSFKDIVVIHPVPLKAKSDFAPLRKILFDRHIESHIAGVNTSKDDFFLDNSIACTSIYRAKGNEAAMIYVINAEQCYAGFALIRKRNILFTALTRSKGWIRAYGVGDSMQGLINEFERVKEQHFTLKFRYPTLEEMDKLNVLHRDLTQAEMKVISESERAAADLIKRLRNQEIQVTDLSKETIEQLKELLSDD
jgi:superfamily I DNA and RNA helicase